METQTQTQKRKQTTPLPCMNNKLNNKQITLYIYIVISPRQSTEHRAHDFMVTY